MTVSLGNRAELGISLHAAILAAPEPIRIYEGAR